MKDKLAKRIDVKSIVTPALTGAMAGILFSGVEIRQEALARYCTSCGAMIPYFFTRKSA